MSQRRSPVETTHTSTVVYPSGLFLLERDETYPYERFAHNLLDVAVEALHKRKLPDSLTVDFARFSHSGSPWTINSSVAVESATDGSPTGFRFETPELVPAIIYLLTATLISDFFDEKGFEKFHCSPATLREKIQLFVDAASAGIRAYRDRGFGHGVRASYDHLGLMIGDMQRCANEYDLLTKQIAYHEVAHVYVEQLTREPRPTQTEARSFELIADLIATEWLYRKMIVNTPNTVAYSQFRGMNSYAETIFANSLLSQRSQQALIILMAIAGAQRSAGVVTLAGGQTHPPGMQRFLLQHAHLQTLIRSNFSTVLSEDRLCDLDVDWDEKMGVLVRSGLIPLKDLKTALDVSECETVELAANLVEERDIQELKKAVPFLRSIREWTTGDH